jgi:hypothetical protein
MVRNLHYVWLSLVIGGMTASTCYAPPPIGEIEVTDPKEALKDPDFSVQGEYLGEGTLPDGHEDKVGAQVIAKGHGRFRVVVYRGGLPGAGWQRGGERFMLDGQREENRTTLAGKSLGGTIVGDAMTVTDPPGNEKIKLKRIERQSPTLGRKPPAGAIVLFDGAGTEHWARAKLTKEGNLWAGALTKPLLESCRLHVEFRLAWMPEDGGQARSNSGVYVHESYEIQVLDSFGLEGKSNECGGLYATREPIVNACLPPLVWQTYDIDFTAPRYEDGTKAANARITVRHNGVLIHDDVELERATGGGKPEGPGPRGLFLQGIWSGEAPRPGNKVQYRNVWAEKK